MSVQITASMVNDLRQKTGVGLMDCKRALVESKGDIEKAQELAGQPVSLTDFRLTGVANKSRIQNQRRRNDVSF